MIAQNTRILWLPGEDRHFDYESGGWSGGGRNPAGVRIDPETALRSTVVLACVRVLSSSVAGLPLHLYRRLPSGGKELARENPLYRVLHDRPNSWQSSYEWREQIMLHLLTHGQAFVEISGAGPQTQLVALHPSRMKVEQIENGRLRYTYREASGGSTVYAQDAMMHLRWLSDDGVNGMVPVELAKDAIGLARACEIHGASFFANGARPGIVLSTDQTLSPEAAMNTRDQWERAHRGPDRAHKTAVLQGGLKVNELGGNNQEAQFLEARRFQVEEVCRIYGVPPHLVGDLSRSSFSNIEQQSLDYVQNGLMPWLRRIESAIARDLVGDEELFAEFDVRGALRADAAGRASYYNAMWNLGVLSVNEIRAAENLNPVEGGDTRFVQLNMQTLDKAVAQPEPAAEPAPSEPATPAEPVARSLPQSRALTLSIDFDRTFAADPQLWGEFARKAVADGNTVVMVSRREDTPEDRQTVTDTLGEYADAFSQVLLVGDRLKDEAAKEAGVNVDVWVDDSPQFIRSESRCGANASGGGGFQPGNTCGKGGGGGGSGIAGSYGNIPGDGTPYDGSRQTEKLISDLRDRHQTQRDTFDQEKADAVAAQKSEHKDEQKAFEREAKKREKELAKSGDDKALEEHKASVARDRAAMKERHEAAAKETEDKFAARKQELEKQFKEDKEAYQTLRNEQKKEWDELQKAGEASLQQKLDKADADYKAEVKQRTKEIKDKFEPEIQRARESQDADRLEDLENERKEAIVNANAEAKFDRDERVEQIEEDHAKSHEAQENNLLRQQQEAVHSTLQGRLDRYPEPAPPPAVPAMQANPQSKADEQLIAAIGQEAYDQLFGRRSVAKRKTPARPHPASPSFGEVDVWGTRSEETSAEQPKRRRKKKEPEA